jgi:hypothetical protein
VQVRHGRLPRRLLTIAAVIPIGVSIFRDSPVPWMTRSLATMLWVLCLLPAFSYLKRDPRIRRPIPFFPAICLLFGLYYTLPLVLGVTDNYYNAPVYPETDYDYPVQLAFLGFIAMAGAYLGTGFLTASRKRPTPVAWNPKLLTRVGFILMFAGMAVTGLRTVLFSSGLLGGMLQFILSVQWLGVGILIILARRGELSPLDRNWLRFGFIVSAAMLLAGGNIAPMAMFFAIGAFALWIAQPYFRPRWIVGATVAVVLAFSFRGIVIDYRRTMADTRVELTQSEALGLMFRLLGERINEQGVGGAIAHGFGETAGRSAIMDLFANVVRRTPDEIPYWNGETYKSLIGAVVPRVLWPDKPTKDLGQSFGHRYKYLHASNKSTAINLPTMVEFFVNFGGTGLVIGMLILGIIYGSLDSVVNRPGQPMLLSMIGAVILLPLLIIESDFSLVLGGLPLTGIAFYVIWWQLRRALNASARISSKRPSAQVSVAGKGHRAIQAGNT